MISPELSPTEQAARNNALWCDAVCRAHGAKTVLTDDVWFNWQKSPPFYPNVDTLSRDGIPAQMEAIQALVDVHLPGGWGVKDSFCTLDLASLGFHLLFEATWLWRSPVSSNLAYEHWKKVQSPQELVRWESAWRGEPAIEGERIFLPSLLEDENIVFLAHYQNQQMVAGAVLNRTGDVVGISNVFYPANQGSHVWAGVIATAEKLFPDLPFVGYEQGNDLAIAYALGFENLGPLRVWIHPS